MHCHSCSRFGGLVVVLSFFAACPAARAADGHWTGAVDGFYTNASNWAEGAVPGRFYTPSPAGGFTTNDAPCDTAYFGDDLTGNRVTTIDFDGVHSISNLLTVGKTVQYTYGTKSDQFVPIAALGTFSAGETPDTRVAIIACRLRTAVDCFEITDKGDGTYSPKYGGDTVTIRNNSSEEFVLGEWGWRTTKYAIDPVHKTSSGDNIGIGSETGIRWAGSGDIRVTKAKGGGQPNPQTQYNMTGKLTFEALYEYRSFSMNATTGFNTIERQIVMTKDGIFSHPGGAYNGLTVGGSVPTRFSGPGTFRVNNAYHSTDKWKSSAMSFNSATVFACPMEITHTKNTTAGVYDLPLWTGFWFTGGAGPVTFACAENENAMTGTLFIASSTTAATVNVPKLGLRGTRGAHGDMDISIVNNGVLRYTGAGDTTDRTLFLTNHYVNSKETTKRACAGVLEQAGTGSLVVNSSVQVPTDDTGTLTLRNATDQDATFGAVLTGALNVKKDGSGIWKFAAANDYAGTTSVDAGTLYVCRGATLGQGQVTVAANAALVFEGAEEGGDALQVDCPAVAVSGVGATLRVGKGCTVTLAGCTQSGGGSLDIVTEDKTAVAKITGQTGDAPAWLTLNGRAAAFAGDGTVKKFTISVNATIPVHGGVLPNDTSKNVGIVDGGEGGNVTLAATATAVGAVVQQAADAATVEVGAGATLTTAALAIDEDKGDLTVGTADGQGTLAAAATALRIWPESSNATITVRSTPALSAATEIQKLGFGLARFVTGFDSSTTVRIENGELAVTPAGTAQNFTLAGEGTFAKEGTGNWTVSKASPSFSGDYVVRGGTLNPGATAASTLFGAAEGGELVVTNGARLNVFGTTTTRDIDYGLKRLRVAGEGALAINVSPVSAPTKPFNSVELAGDTSVTGTVANDSKDFYLVSAKSSRRAKFALNGHTLTKGGYGRLGLADVDLTGGGTIALTTTPGFTTAGTCNMLFFAGLIDVTEPTRLVTADGTMVASSGAHPAIPIDWEISGTCYFGPWSVTADTNQNNWAGEIRLADAKSRLSLYNYADPTRRTVVSGKISGPGGVTNQTVAGWCYLAAPTNTYTGETRFVFPNGSGSYGAALFARSTTIPDFSKAYFSWYGAGIGRLSPDGNTSWPIAEVGRLLRTANFSNHAFFGLDLGDVGDYSFNISELGEPPTKTSGFGRHCYTPDEYVLTVNLDTDWNAPTTVFQGYGGTLRLSGAHVLTVDLLRGSGNRLVTTGVVEIVDGADVRAQRESTFALNDDSVSVLRIRNATLSGPAGKAAGSRTKVNLGNCTYSSGIVEMQEGGELYGTVYAGIGVNGYGGAIYQTGGRIHDPDTIFNLASGARGHWEISGGASELSGAATMRMAYDSTNVASSIVMTGGRLSFTGSKAPMLFGGNKNGHSHIDLKGGTMAFAGTTAGRAMEYPYSASSACDSTGVITLEGETALLSVTNTQNMFLANQTNGVAIVNLNAGVLEVGSIQACASKYPGSVAFLNFDGGTLRANMSNATWLKGLTRVGMGAKGGVIDTAGYDVTISSAIEKPAAEGQGVAAVDWSYAAKVEIPYFVHIVGDGQGASAIIDYDRATRRMTGVRIISPGSGYTWAKALITSGQCNLGYGYHTEVPCTLGANATSGGLTKTGAGKLTLTGANTYEGATVVAGGTLRLENASALPAGSDVVLCGGGIEAAAGVALPGEVTVDADQMDFSNERVKYVLATVAAGQTAPTVMVNGTLPWGWEVVRRGDKIVLRCQHGMLMLVR